MKRILLACGSGLASSSVARARLERFLDENGYGGDYVIDQCKVAEAPALSANYDFLVATVMAPQHLQCPYVNGVPFLLGEDMGRAQEEVRALMG